MEARQGIGATTSCTALGTASITVPADLENDGANEEITEDPPQRQVATASRISLGAKLTVLSANHLSLLEPAVTAASSLMHVTSPLIATGSMAFGWTSTGTCQTILRDQATQLKMQILRIQHLLAAIDRLECPVCAEDITLADEVRRCSRDLHCCHVACLERNVVEGGALDAPCCICGGSLDSESYVMVDSFELFVSGHLAAASVPFS